MVWLNVRVSGVPVSLTTSTLFAVTDRRKARITSPPT